MKINCQEGFRCREHCQDHCYDEHGYIWHDHYMFCGQEENDEVMRELNLLNTVIIKGI
jgi:hypothetical protein